MSTWTTTDQTAADASPLETAGRAAPKQLRLLTNDPVRPTPAGAFRAVSRPEPGPVGRMLLEILRSPVTPYLTLPSLQEWTGCNDPQRALRVLEATSRRKPAPRSADERGASYSSCGAEPTSSAKPRHRHTHSTSTSPLARIHAS